MAKFSRRGFVRDTTMVSAAFAPVTPNRSTAIKKPIVRIGIRSRGPSLLSEE
ncbi:MAG: twin-arginine translocation signal domain-containing protein [Deltaproteobacteria bacterium]|nr:twin-arginine translocation signal domain-containing protein [Deltaproteobacteria bacterium]